MRADLLAAPAEGLAQGLAEALSAVDAFDQALAGGLLRPHPAQSAGLARIAKAVAGTPLAAPVAEAAGKAAAGAAGEEHFVALAAARVALLGAVHDALVTEIAAATGRLAPSAGIPIPPASIPPPSIPPASATGTRGEAPSAHNLLTAARSWLSDLARTGWQALDLDVVAGAAPVIGALLADPALRRLATLLDGFAAELAACCPVSALARIPARRWADLWSRALLLTQPGAATPATVTCTATGRLLPLGVDLQEHATAAQAQVHAVFEPADGGVARLVRTSVCAPKPDSVIGAGVWQLLRPHMSLLTAASAGRAMELADMPLTSAGDLIWSDRQARLAEPVSPPGGSRRSRSMPEGGRPARPARRAPRPSRRPPMPSSRWSNGQDGCCGKRTRTRLSRDCLAPGVNPGLLPGTRPGAPLWRSACREVPGPSRCRPRGPSRLSHRYRHDHPAYPVPARCRPGACPVAGRPAAS
jgi:hypothetical protein